MCEHNVASSYSGTELFKAGLWLDLPVAYGGIGVPICCAIEKIKER
jgi:hypothetical protein